MTTDTGTAELLERLRTAVTVDHRQQRRHRTAAFLLVTSLLLTGVAVAAATQAPWWSSAAPAVDPEQVALVAKELLPATVNVADARTVARSGSAALVAVPLELSGYCLIPTLAGRGDLGAQCQGPMRHPKPGANDQLSSYVQPAGRFGGPAWLLYGRVTDPGAAAIDLGALTVELGQGGFFLAEIPSDRWHTLAATANPGSILSASGATLSTGCVNWGPSPDSPLAGRSDTDLWLAAKPSCTPSLPAAPLRVDPSHARRLFELTLLNDFSLWKAGTTIAFWKATGPNGEPCVAPGALSHAPTPYGWRCEGPGVAPYGNEPIALGMGGLRVHVNGHPTYAHSASGWVNPASGIASMRLQTPHGDSPVAVADNYFFVQIPGTSSAFSLPTGGPFTLVGYDRKGNVVVSIDLSKRQGRRR